MNNLHKKLLNKYPLYKKWHENKASNALHFAILIMVPVLFFLSISDGINNTLSQLGATGTALVKEDRGVVSSEARQAESIVRGKAVNSGPFEETNSYGDRLIMTQVTLAVTENIKGGSMREVKVDMVGGTLNGITMSSSHDPDPLIPGEEAVVFLKKGATGQYRIQGNENGVYRIRNGGITGRGLTLDELKAAINASR